MDDNENIQDHGTQSASMNTLPVVSRFNEKGEKKRKMEILFIILGIVAIIVISAVIVSAVGKKNKDKEFSEEPVLSENAGDNEDSTPVTSADDVSVTFDGTTLTFTDEVEIRELENLITTAEKPDATTISQLATTMKNSQQAQTKPTKQYETTTKYIETTTVVTTKAAQQSNKALADISAFFSGKYYLDGSMISDGEKSPFEIAMNGNDFQVYSELDGTDISIMSLGGKLYMLNPDSKKYAELNAAFRSIVGINEEDFKFEFSTIKFDGSKPTEVKKATYKGSPAVCYVYKGADNHLEFICVNDEIVQFAVFDAAGAAKTALEIEEFSAQIPSNMLNFKGYNKTNIVSFMKDLM